MHNKSQVVMVMGEADAEKCKNKYTELRAKLEIIKYNHLQSGLGDGSATFKASENARKRARTNKTRGSGHIESNANFDLPEQGSMIDHPSSLVTLHHHALHIKQN